MNPGKMRHKIELQQRKMEQDSHGEQVDTWTTQRTVFAGIETVRGREFEQGEALQSEVTHKVTVRYDATLTPDMRIKYGDRYFQILHRINKNERDRQYELMCREVYEDGRPITVAD